MVFTFSVMLIMLQSQDLNVNVSWKKITNPVDYEHVYSWFDELQYMYKKTYFNLNMLGKK